MSAAVLEAELILAPIKVQATFRAAAIGVQRFLDTFGFPPSITAIGSNMLACLIAVDADRYDVQWLIDAGFMPVEFMTEWEVASRAHNA